MPSTYTPITSTTLQTVSSSISFTSITNTYTDLVLVLFGRSTRGSTDDTIYMRFNNDSAGNYSRTRLLGQGSGASSERQTNTAYILFDILSAANNPTNDFSTNIYQIQNYANTNINKYVFARANNANGSFVFAGIGLWRSTSAINRIDIGPLTGPNFLAGTTATLYGIKAA